MNGPSAHLRLSHRALGAAFSRCAAHAEQLAATPNAAALRAYLRYVDTALTAFDAHHRLEEDVLFPLFARRDADAPVRALIDEHATLKQLEAAVRAARVEVARDPAALRGLAAAWRALYDACLPHFADEERAFDDAWYAAHLAPDALLAFGKQVAQHSQQHHKPAARLLPFILYNLAPDDRAVFAARMPRFVTQVLVRHLFKWVGWRDMHPFLAYPPRSLRPWAR